MQGSRFGQRYSPSTFTVRFLIYIYDLVNYTVTLTEYYIFEETLHTHMRNALLLYDKYYDQCVFPTLCFRLLSKTTRLSMTRNAVWALSNLCRGKNPAPAFAKVAPCLPILAHLLNHSDFDVLADACWALSYLSDGPNDKIQAVIDAGVCRRLIELLMYATICTGYIIR